LGKKKFQERELSNKGGKKKCRKRKRKREQKESEIH